MGKMKSIHYIMLIGLVASSANLYGPIRSKPNPKTATTSKSIYATADQEIILTGNVTEDITWPSALGGTILTPGFEYPHSSVSVPDYSAEFKDYPERYSGCAFCRCPRKLAVNGRSSNCVDCDLTASIVLAKIFQKLTPDGCTVSDITYEDKLSEGPFKRGYTDMFNGLRHKNIPAFMDYKIYNDVFYKSCVSIKPRFYRGVVRTADGKRQHVWVSNFPTPPRPTTNEEISHCASSITHNIVGPETGAEILASMPEHV